MTDLLQGRIFALAHEVVGVVIYREHTRYSDMVKEVADRLMAAWGELGGPIQPDEWRAVLEPTDDELDQADWIAWTNAVTNDETKLGFVEWQCHQIEAARYDTENENE